MTSIAYGRLIFCKEMNGGEVKPLHNMKVKLFDDDVGPDTLLAEAMTDMEGRFKFTYDPKAAGWLDTPDLKVMVYEVQPQYDKEKKLVTTDVPVTGYEPEVHNNVPLARFDFGDIEVKYWEYWPMPESYTPRLYVNPDKGFPLMQEQRPGRNAEEKKKALQAAGVYFKPPMCKTEKEEMETPGASLGDDALVDMMLNGFNPCIPQKASDGRLYVEFKYDGILLDGVHHAPNTRAYFKYDKDKQLRLDTIELTDRIGGYQRGHDACLGEPVVYSAATSSAEDWAKVKRMWRVNYFLFGEVVTHLGGTHLNIEQYIVPMMRNVRLNPVFNLLFPHFYGTVSINHGADQLLTGGTALVPQGSAVTIDSVATAARGGFTTMNWDSWTPRSKLTQGHYFAELQAKFWEVIAQHVDEYFKEHEKEIVNQWKEIFLWSDELVKNGVPYTQQEDNYYDNSEANKASSPHPKVGHCNVSVSPITGVEALTDANKKENLDRLKQLCRYLLLLTTFKHSWVNDTQYDIGGWPEFATLGLDFNILDPAHTNKDPVTEPIKKKHIVTTWFLRNQKWGYIMKNEAKDMHPRLRELLTAAGEQFASMNYDINDVRCCINT
eukprot:TRINITY_DN95_c0_g1_i12.p1 TRINITY_DN95_c0_g1~~TRINITY_DN95_c0_g1_i12.p1  ORF type:complete len:621 (+),score=313.37 TRINITY_DN95_c0_g1_i12:49-1863(+)